MDYLPRIWKNIVLQNFSQKNVFASFVLSRIDFLQFLQITHLWETEAYSLWWLSVTTLLPLNHIVCVYVCVFIPLGLLCIVCITIFFIQLQASNDQGY